METVGLGLHYEDLPIGRKFRTIGRTVTDADITAFVGCTGMVEVLFTDQEFLRNETNFKGRLAPAMLGHCFIEGLLLQATMQHTALAFLNMVFNIEAPIFAGDTKISSEWVRAGAGLAGSAGQSGEASVSIFRACAVAAFDRRGSPAATRTIAEGEETPKRCFCGRGLCFAGRRRRNGQLGCERRVLTALGGRLLW